MFLKMGRFCLAAAAAACWGGLAAAQSVGPAQFNTIQDAISALGTPLYQSIDPNYSPSSSGFFTFSTGNRVLLLEYLSGSSGTIFVTEDGAEIAMFENASREGAEADLKSFLSDLFRGSPESLRLTTSRTASDPVAGSPVSLQSRMATASFRNGSTVGPNPLTGGNRARGTLSYNHLGISLQSGRYTGPGFSANISTIPLSYAIPLNDPRWALKLDLPISFASIDGVDNISASLGVGLRIPVYDHWTLTPEIRFGTTRNRTQRVTGKIVNASIVSNYHIPLRNGFGLTIGNALTYSSTFGSAYDQKNTINMNGIELSGPFEQKLYGLPTNWQFSVVHTRVGGDPVYVDEWFDVSLSLGTIGSKNNVTWDSVRVGVTYTHANRGVRGLNLNFGYEF